MSGLLINDNIAALNAQQNLSRTQQSVNKHVERLSSGLRINTPADDPAGYSIAQRMGGQIKSYGAAINNADAGNNLLETAGGALQTENAIVLKMRQLAVQAANDTYSAKDRKVLNQEYEHLKNELTRISEVTDFNGMKLLNGSHDKFVFQIGTGTHLADRLSVKLGKTDAKTLGVHGTSVLSKHASENALEHIDRALDRLNVVQGNVGAIQDRMQWTIRNLNTAETNVQASRAGIRDADFSKETSAYVKQQILAQSGAAVLARANQEPKNALNLLG